MFKITYPKNLPITSKKDEILETVLSNQIVILTGETGSGKTTQLPKICLEAGRGEKGLIGCTQPRRIAATSLAKRLAEELDCIPGEEVGFQIRYEEKKSKNTKILFMTDGMILNEIHSDPLLKRYDTIIVDEAHERSLNIDFFLGYLKSILPKRPDLKIIVTSATIDTEKFARFFSSGTFPAATEKDSINNEGKSAYPLLDPKADESSYPLLDPKEGEGGGSTAPIIQVQGKTYPVEIRYTNIDEYVEEDDFNIQTLVIEAVEEILTETNDGDVLVFLVGVQEINEVLESLEFLKDDYELLPLHAGLSNADQNRVFKRSKKRKIICSTNIAETSVTIDTVKYVIDSGNARVARHVYATGTRQLNIEPISQSAANQRAGRCGRTANGICIRLYSKTDFDSRNEYTDPEIIRTDLADIILKLKVLDIGEVEGFPFIDQPPTAQLKSGIRTLKEIRALSTESELTKIGRQIVDLPLDVRTARALLECKNEGVLKEGVIAIAGMTLRDPREALESNQQKLIQARKVLKSENSDVEVLLNIWEQWDKFLNKKFSLNQLKKFCAAYQLSFLRMREWINLKEQLENTCKNLRWRVSYSVDKALTLEKIHRAYVSGFLNHLAKHEEKGRYRATKNRELYIFPGSDFKKKNFPWMLAIEMMETSRLFALRVFPVQKEWIERAASHLLKTQTHSPFWDAKKGRVTIYEKSILFGLVVNERKPVPYAKYDSEDAKRIFIENALMGEEELNFSFFKKNQKLLQDIEQKENKLRKKGLYLNENNIFQFYDQRLTKVSSIHDLKRFLKEKGEQHLFMREQDILKQDVQDSDLPDQIFVGNHALPIQYRFDPEDKQDGINLKIPLELAANIDDSVIELQLPGLLKQKVEWLIEDLPKKEKIKLKPLDESVEEIVSFLQSDYSSLSGDQYQARFLQKVYERLISKGVSRECLNKSVEDLPTHLKPHYKIKKKNKKTFVKDSLSEVKPSKQNSENSEWERWIEPYEKTVPSDWEFEELLNEKEIEIQAGQPKLKTFRGLSKQKTEIKYTLFKARSAAEEHSFHALKSIFEKQFQEELATLRRQLWFKKSLTLQYESLEDLMKFYFHAQHQQSENEMEINDRELSEDLYYSLKRSMLECFPIPETPKAYHKRTDKIQNELKSAGAFSRTYLASLFKQLKAFFKVFSEREKLIPKESLEDMIDVRNELIFPRFLKQVSFSNAVHFERYLKALTTRIEKLVLAPDKETENLDRILIYKIKLSGLKETLSKESTFSQRMKLEELKWMIHEFRVSLWDQKLKTAYPVSEKRLDKQIEEIVI